MALSSQLLSELEVSAPTMVAISCNWTSLFPPSLNSSCSKRNPIRNSTHPNASRFNFSHLHHTSIDSREFPLPGVASVPYQPFDSDYLQTEFTGHGVTFESIGSSCVATMTLDNGASLILMLPSGLITSYKATMWHGGAVELLHSTVSDSDGGDPLVQGGVSLFLNFEFEGNHFWSPTNWSLRDIRGNPRSSIQVELVSSDEESLVQLKLIVTLEKDGLSSELVVSNSRHSALKLRGGILSHLTVSTPDATYAVGLENSNFSSTPPFPSDFCIIPPTNSNAEEADYNVMGAVKRLLPWWVQPNLNTRNNKSESSPIESEEMEMEMEDNEETDNCKSLTEQMCLIYTNAPRNFTIIDRGRRNSVVVGREGFEELYLFSPGSNHEYYGDYAFICVGQSATRKPIILEPEQMWSGKQHFFNPNL